MPYRKRFDPDAHDHSPDPAPEAIGDRRDGQVYVYRDEIVLAVNVALATGRPLLLEGPSGSGKSTLARHVARVLGWRYYEHVVTSRLQAQDLLWRFDTLRRLNDAQTQALHSQRAAYLEPGVLWWAFDPGSAISRGANYDAGVPEAEDPTGEHEGAERAVVLIDEIDKAEPDVPNNLLVPLGSLEFVVDETGAHIRAEPTRAPLVVITTNGERALPRAFLRRCVALTLPAPDADRLVEIARAHFGEDSGSLYRDVAVATLNLSDSDDQPGLSRRSGERPAPSTAEYLDTLRACQRLGISPSDPDWDGLTALTVHSDTP